MTLPSPEQRGDECCGDMGYGRAFIINAIKIDRKEIALWLWKFYTKRYSNLRRSELPELECFIRQLEGEKVKEMMTDYCEKTRPPRDVICQKAKGHKGRHRAVIFWEDEQLEGEDK
jgi:hypothetical protein